MKMNGREVQSSKYIDLGYSAYTYIVYKDGGTQMIPDLNKNKKMKKK
jgi:hypothetical protein